MAGALEKLALKWDILSGRYKVFFASEPDDVAACLSVLDEVRRQELNRVVGGSVVTSHAFAGQELSYRLAACRDTKTGQIVGCVRITGALETSRIPASREEYRLDLFDEATLAHMTIFTRLVVTRAYRKTPAALVLLTQCFKAVLAEGDVASLLACEPNLYPMYLRLGMRPIGPLHSSPAGGFRIPMICIPDRDYYKQVGTPALGLLSDLNYPAYEPMRRWYREAILGPSGPNLGFSLYDGKQNPEHRVLTEGMSTKGASELVQNAMAIHCKAGDVVIGEDDGGKALGFVVRGSLDVRIGDRSITTLGPGEVFGELAVVADVRRSAALVAASDDTEIVLLSVAAIGRLSDARDQVVIWRKLARIVAQRLISRNLA